MVKVGFANPPVGNTEDPATKRLVMPCTRQSLSTTPAAASLAIRVVPMWWQPHVDQVPWSGAAGAHGHGQPGSMSVLVSIPQRRRTSAATIGTDLTMLSQSCALVRHHKLTLRRPSLSTLSLRVIRLSGFGPCSARTKMSASIGPSLIMLLFISRMPSSLAEISKFALSSRSLRCTPSLSARVFSKRYPRRALGAAHKKSCHFRASGTRAFAASTWKCSWK